MPVIVAVRIQRIGAGGEFFIVGQAVVILVAGAGRGVGDTGVEVGRVEFIHQAVVIGIGDAGFEGVDDAVVVAVKRHVRVGAHFISVILAVAVGIRVGRVGAQAAFLVVGQAVAVLITGAGVDAGNTRIVVGRVKFVADPIVIRIVGGGI